MPFILTGIRFINGEDKRLADTFAPSSGGRFFPLRASPIFLRVLADNLNPEGLPDREPSSKFISTPPSARLLYIEIAQASSMKISCSSLDDQ